VSNGYRITGAQVADIASGSSTIERDILIVGDRIASSSRGICQVLDARGCIVLPGFVDVHVHLAPTWGGRAGPNMVVRAGCTFAVDVTGPVEAVVELVAASHVPLPIRVCEAVRPDQVGSSVRAARTAVASALDRGALGIKILGGHFPLSPTAQRNVIAACAEVGCLCVVHVGSTRTYSDIKGLEETLDLADGLPVHIAHLNGYCRGYHGQPLDEAVAALNLIQSHENATSDSYVFPWNALPLAHDGEVLESHATRFWLDRLGYSPDIHGALSAWADGIARLVVPVGDVNALVDQSDAKGRRERWIEKALYLSLPVNPVEVGVAMAGARGKDGRSFVVDCLATDGGGIPRNSMVPVAWALQRLGVWSWTDVIQKTAVRPAELVGLPPRGSLEPGVVADLTLIDLETGSVAGTIVEGKLAWWRGPQRR
jgi:hypothetical protein